MLTLARMGAVVIPPEPAFYLEPQDITDIVNFVVARVLVALGVDQSMPNEMQYEGPEA